MSGPQPDMGVNPWMDHTLNGDFLLNGNSLP